ncbi:MAG: hypothetical protein IJ128_01810 [Firmicutes bacterium]|nr:hypothetical protein [Bacillota bacterium]
MELTEKKKTIIIVAILVAIALASIFLVSGAASSEDSFTGTYSSLDAKRTTVTELMGVTAASSTAISLLPGDAGTPIADQLADLSGYFLFILAAICLEKWMVTEKIDASYEASIQQTIEDTRSDNQQIQDTVGDEEDQGVIEKLFDKVKGGVSGQLDKFENTLNRITESIAVLIVTSCAIPIAVIIFFLWLVKLLTGVSIEVPYGKLKKPGKPGL